MPANRGLRGQYTAVGDIIGVWRRSGLGYGKPAKHTHHSFPGQINQYQAYLIELTLTVTKSTQLLASAKLSCRGLETKRGNE